MAWLVNYKGEIKWAQQTKYVLPEKPEPQKQPEVDILSYTIPEDSEILVPKDVFGKRYVIILDFDMVVTTQKVVYDPLELVFDGGTGLANLPVEFGKWAEPLMGFRLPANDRRVDFFLVHKKWVDIRVKPYYVPTNK